LKVRLRIRYPPAELPPELTFGQVIGKGAPSLRGIVLSVCVHGLVIAGLGLISFTAPPEKPRLPVLDAAPTVIRISGRLYYVTRVSPADRTVTPTPVQRQMAGKRPTPAPAQTPIPAEPRESVTAPVAESAPAPRVFVPPQSRKNVESEVTLLQPLWPVNVVPINPQLPSFSIHSVQLHVPRIPKQFVAPGRRTPPPPDPTQPPPPPNPDLVQAEPMASNLKPMLVMPLAGPPPIDPPPPKTSASVAPPTQAGDPVEILSLNDKPVPLKDKIVVPPGNIVGRTGDSASAGGMVAILGSGAGPGSGAGRPSVAPASQVIIRPANGKFDAVIIQSSSLDQFPEGKGLLTGKPIYTVYISLGTPKDWALYFCIPGEQPTAASNPSIINLGPATPLQAPYPTRLVRPQIDVPQYYKYILVHGFVSATGRFENLSVVRPIQPETDQAVVTSLSGWEFRAATRDGVKIAVEFLLSIPVIGL
jgi:hypothetical protein